MATTLKEIQGFMDEAKLKYQLSEEKGGFLVVPYSTRAYRAPDGDEGVRIIIRGDDGGETLSMFAPGLYVYKEGPHALAVFGACLHASYITKFVQYEWDPADGEIRAEIELPLVDARLTASQFHRCLDALISIIDSCDPMIRGAIETGKIAPPSLKAVPAVPPGMEELMRLLAAADPEKLRQMLEQAGAMKPPAPTER